jgi:hypothetical protein
MFGIVPKYDSMPCLHPIQPTATNGRLIVLSHGRSARTLLRPGTAALLARARRALGSRASRSVHGTRGDAPDHLNESSQIQVNHGKSHLIVLNPVACLATLGPSNARRSDHTAPTSWLLFAPVKPSCGQSVGYRFRPLPWSLKHNRQCVSINRPRLRRSGRWLSGLKFVPVRVNLPAKTFGACSRRPWELSPKVIGACSRRLSEFSPKVIGACSRRLSEFSPKVIGVRLKAFFPHQSHTRSHQVTPLKIICNVSPNFLN